MKSEKIRKIQTLRELRALRGEPKRPAHKTVSAKLSHRTLKHPNFKDLIVYKKAFEHAMKIFHVTKTFPKVEQYSLTDQIRRSSRSICANIGEAWRKRRYPAHFVSKLTDSDAETSETMIWLDFALECGYVDLQVHKELASEYEQVGKMLGSMISTPEKFCYSEKK